MTPRKRDLLYIVVLALAIGAFGHWLSNLDVSSYFGEFR